MEKHRLHILCLSIACLLTSAVSVAQNIPDFEEGLLFYKQRHKHAKNFVADTSIILKAIHYFEKAHQKAPSEKTYEYLMRSYYFTAYFASTNDKQKEHWYEKAMKTGKKGVAQYPESAPILYWYIAACSQYAAIKGIWYAINNNVVSEMHKAIDKLIQIDPEYQGGGGYRNKGILYYKLPYIPFVLTFPSNDKAIEYFQKALAIDPVHPTTLFFYGDCLKVDGQKEKAKQVFQKTANLKPRPAYYLEDAYLIYKARKALDEL